MISKNELGPYELEVGLSGDEREVIVNHPEMTPSPGGRGGHIVFSPKQARAFAARMIEKANACVGESGVETPAPRCPIDGCEVSIPHLHPRDFAGQKHEPPITFEALSYALFSLDDNAVLTTAHGNLAIFSTKGMAELWAKSSKRKIRVVPVQVTPRTEQ